MSIEQNPPSPALHTPTRRLISATGIIAWVMIVMGALTLVPGYQMFIVGIVAGALNIPLGITLLVLRRKALV